MDSSADGAAGAFDEIDYVEQRGPGIPEITAPPALPAGELDQQPEPASIYPGWEPETVEQFLSGTGHGLHLLIGAGEKDWLMTRTDLDRIAPPLTRILNRYEPSLRASVYADPLLVAHGLGLYGWRSALQRQAALRARAEQAGDTYVDVSQVLDAEPAPNGRPAAEPGSDEYIPYAQRRPQ
jgi:hypothetical protein